MEALPNLDPITRRTPQLFRGIFAGTYGLGEEAEVILDAEEFGGAPQGPAYWEPQITNVGGDPSILSPQRGDRCLVAFDDARLPWIVVWWPYG